jgi:hypothetical protein
LVPYLATRWALQHWLLAPLGFVLCIGLMFYCLPDRRAKFLVGAAISIPALLYGLALLCFRQDGLAAGLRWANWMVFYVGGLATYLCFVPSKRKG